MGEPSPFIPPLSSPSASPSSSEEALDILPGTLISLPPPHSTTENNNVHSAPLTYGPYQPFSPPASPSLVPPPPPPPPDDLVPQQLQIENNNSGFDPSKVEDQRVVSFIETPSIIPTLPPPINRVPREYFVTHNYFFNLSAPKFAPMRFGDAGKLDYVRSEEFERPASDPPVYRLRILCNLTPWPIIFQPNLDRLPKTHQLPPITIGDVLVKIYYSMHLPIQKEDWERLPEQSQLLVARAYRRRCRLSGPMEEEEKSKGVKRIDFCQTYVWFDRLVALHSEDGTAVIMLHLSEGSL